MVVNAPLPQATAGTDSFRDPDRSLSLTPFWFLNDTLDELEIRRQIDDFERHGVFGFVLHARVGLPRDIGWMSDRMLHFWRVAIEEAARRGMFALLYDEGMYPSGSSHGQVVAENPAYACRGLIREELDDGREPSVGPEGQLLAVLRRRNGRRVAVIEGFIHSHIRGLHYEDHDAPRNPPGQPEPRESRPPAADLLNPDAVACFIRRVHDRFADAFGEHFGRTIPAIFTDEPSMIGRPVEADVMPGTRDILTHVNAQLGEDFTPHLLTLWHDDEPDAMRHRRRYQRAVHGRLEQTYYKPLHAWCAAHDLMLTGHPQYPDDIGPLRFFDIPGQDLVWRDVLPGNKAVIGRQSTQGKCASSAMIHRRRRRNASELLGAYGHELTYDLMKWLTDWVLVRGANMLLPHAFYYSIRGPRLDERPPDVGPNSGWWDRYRDYSDYCRRLCWINTDAMHVCEVAILGETDRLSWDAARVCFEHQRDFNYLEQRHLWEDASVDDEGIHLAEMCYRVLIVEDSIMVDPRAEDAIARLTRHDRVIRYQSGQPTRSILDQIDSLVERDVVTESPQPGLRYRHVIKRGAHYYLFVNEHIDHTIDTPLSVAASGAAAWLNPATGERRGAATPLCLNLAPYESSLLMLY